MSLKDYKIGKIIGQGSFAYVSLVSRKSDKKIFAMKTSKIGKLSLKEKELALNEIRILYSLDHPNIISYIDSFFDEESKTLNTIMEYAENGDLKKKISSLKQKKYHFTENQIWKFIIQILLGMNYLHDNNIIHRDLKSENMFITKKGILKIGDLNISKFSLNGLARTQTGTPYYCSPEIWDDHAYDKKSDVWSVGCIIYELCTLDLPFKGKDIKELALNIKKGYYESISNYYSNDLQTLISYMLIVDPRKRFSSKQLINCDIVKSKIEMFKNDDIYCIIKNNENHCNVNMIDTIRLPQDLNDINKKLPKKKKIKKSENEMMMNDEYETMKSNKLKDIANEIKNEIKKEENENNNYNHNYFLDKNDKEKQNNNDENKLKKKIENGNNRNKFNMKKEQKEPIKIHYKEDEKKIQKNNDYLLNPNKIITPNPEEKIIFENHIKNLEIEFVNNKSNEEKKQQKNSNDNKNNQSNNNNQRPLSSKNKPNNLNKIPNGKNRPSSNIHSNKNPQKNKNNLIINNVNLNNYNNNDNNNNKQINIPKKNVKIEKVNYKIKKKPISRCERIYKAMGFNCINKKKINMYYKK